MATPINLAAIDRLIQRHITQFRGKGVYTLRPGYKFTGGWITDKPAIVETVDKKLDGLTTRDRLPTEIDDLTVDVREATGLQRLRVQDPCSTPWSPATVERNTTSQPGNTSATSRQGQDSPLPKKSAIQRSPCKGINSRSHTVRLRPW